MAQHTRRQMLGTTLSTLAIGSMAGCAGSALRTADSGDDVTTARASFFVFGDFASHVAGDSAVSETLVPVGQHGHGWEPGPKIQGDVLDADIFVYGIEGFQPWADDVAANVREDDADTALVRVGSNVDLLDVGHHEKHDEEENHDDHDEENPDEHEEGDHDDEANHEEGHDHSDGTDPHFWLDPVRAKRAVETVREGFVNADDANADAYAENADTYTSRLDDLHADFESTLETASKDMVLVAGHDAFGYLAARYGFEVESLTGVSPDDTPTPKDIETAQHIVEEHDIDYVLADPLESQKAANQLVAETDAEAVLPLTSIPGRTDEWDQQGWGYVDIMTEINLPTLKRALDAE